MDKWPCCGKISGLVSGLTFMLVLLSAQPGDAYDPVDPNGNLTIKWDIISWTPDGYVAVVRLVNYQQYRHIESPGWTLGWTGLRRSDLNVTCIYSQFVAQRTPSCCVSFSSFYNDTIVPCPVCSCGCQDNINQLGNCVEKDSPYLKNVRAITPAHNNAPLVQCTSHMCPIRIHWHVKTNYKEYWRVKITITNFNYRMNYTDWNIVAQHPNFNNLSQIFSFNYKSLNPYESLNDTALFWGIKFYNDMLMHAGSMGNVQSELLLKKDKETFSFKQGWAFPGEYTLMVMIVYCPRQMHTLRCQTIVL